MTIFNSGGLLVDSPDSKPRVARLVDTRSHVSTLDADDQFQETVTDIQENIETISSYFYSYMASSKLFMRLHSAYEYSYLPRQCLHTQYSDTDESTDQHR